MTVNTKERILVTAERMFMKFGIKSVSMDDLARDLGISKKTLYQSIENKEDLIRQMVEERIRMDKEACGAAREQSSNALEEILVIGRNVVRELREMPDQVIFELKKYYRTTFQLFEDFHKEFIFKTIKENVERGIREGLYREDLNSEVIAKLYVGKNMMIVDEESFPLDKYHRDELFQEHFKYHIRGIASLRGLKLLDKYSNLK